MRTTNPLAGLFGKSPFRALQKHMAAVEQCVEQLPPLFEALEKGDMDAVAGYRDSVYRLENEADDLKNEIRSRLPRGLFMPVDRRDLLDLLDAQDSIADTAQDVAGFVLLRRMEIKPYLSAPLAAFLATNLEATRKCGEVINELDELVETGFRGRQVGRVTALITELGAIEHRGDEQEIELVTLLFDNEGEMRPLSVVFWYELLRTIGDIADYAEDVGDRLRLLVAR